MTTLLDHARTEWHPDGPLVFTSDRQLRPALETPLDWFTVHWTGAGQWGDIGDTAAELLSVELNHARPTGKPNEYNSASDSQSVTWEYAGPFRAAHSEGENEEAWGHLVFAGPSDELVPALMTAYVLGIRRARWQLMESGNLTRGHRVTKHRDMPGAETACPGPLAEEPWWTFITAPVIADPDAPVPPPPDPGPTPLPPTLEPSIMRDARVIRFRNLRFLWTPATNSKQWASASGDDPDAIVRLWQFLIGAAGGNPNVWDMRDNEVTLFRALGEVAGRRNRLRMDRFGVPISNTTTK